MQRDLETAHPSRNDVVEPCHQRSHDETAIAENGMKREGIHKGKGFEAPSNPAWSGLDCESSRWRGSGYPAVGVSLTASALYPEVAIAACPA